MVGAYIMTVYFNNYVYSIIIPREVLEAVGKPENITIYWKADERRILFRGVDKPCKNSYDVPPTLYTNYDALVFPPLKHIKDTKKALGWDDDMYAVECRVVRNRDKDKDNEKMILCDLNTAQKSEDFNGTL